MKNMTALVSCFVRGYHTQNNEIKIYDDKYAKSILSEDEYTSISENMKNGISFFNPNYNGKDPLTWIVNNQLAPSVLARSVLAEDYLNKSIITGLRQYVIIASGYDTSAYKLNKKINVFEVDQEDIVMDKQRRIKLSGISKKNITYVGCDLSADWISKLIQSGYRNDQMTFCTCLGISYYLEKDEFIKLIDDLSKNMPNGCSIVFDYPNNLVSEKERINQNMARALNEEMKSTYSLGEIKSIAKQTNMYIAGHFSNDDIDRIYFSKYNMHNPENKINCPRGVSYCLLTKNKNYSTT